MTVHVGVDVGGTKAHAVVTDAAGSVLASHLVPTARGNWGVVAATLEAVDGALTGRDFSMADIDSVGVGVPGAVVKGVVSHAVNLGIERLDLADELETAWGVRPAVENDVNAAAVGAWSLVAHDVDSMAYLNLGTGLAAGIILGGTLWRGARGAAGEIGHVSVDPSGPRGPDGLPGGLEAYAGGAAISFVGRTGATAQELLADPAHGDVRQGMYFGVASAIRLLVLTLDVERVVLGGGLTRIGAPLVDGVTAQLREWAGQSRFLTSVELESRFSVLEPQTPVAAVGAAMVGAGHG